MKYLIFLALLFPLSVFSAFGDLDENGYSDITPASDVKLIYVALTEGNYSLPIP